jgi:hypothetical protein
MKNSELIVFSFLRESLSKLYKACGFKVFCWVFFFPWKKTNTHRYGNSKILSSILCAGVAIKKVNRYNRKIEIKYLFLILDVSSYTCFKIFGS